MKQNITRRGFLGQVGSGALGVAGLSQLQYLQAAGKSRAAAGWQAPPSLTNPNILIVMVDQMRWPVWMDAHQVALFEQQIMPNLMTIRDNAFVFDQYYTAATICTAARGTLMTGLYAPQTACYTNSLTGTNDAALSPGFPTWGDAVAKINPAYQNNCWWFGKWHLSPVNSSTPLVPYGFNTRTYPGGPNANPSPNGVANEGTDGGLFSGKYWANDSDITNDFLGWLSGQAPTTGAPPSPWCATVSLINPHDISDAPAWLQSNPFPPKGVTPTHVYFPPPPFPPASGAPALYSAQPNPWNLENLATVTNKPAVQYAYHTAQIKASGHVVSWPHFLNQYYWLHNYADQQIGKVLDAVNSSPYASNTIVVFVADHGEYGGSHGLHDKGCASYDEVIHVPLYVHFPGQTGMTAMNQMCSSVDFFGLMCDLATNGSGQWKRTYSYLSKRQSLWSFMETNAAETRIAPNLGVPYIFHTSDDSASTGATLVHHIVCLRTKTNPANTAQPGAKLAVYSEWGKCRTVPNTIPQDFEFYDYNPATTNNQYELGNDYFSSNATTQATIQAYLAELGVWGPPDTGLIASELNAPAVGKGTDGLPLYDSYLAGRQNYFDYVYGIGVCKT